MGEGEDNYQNELRLKLIMILAEKLEFPMDFSQKFSKHSSTVVLPWQQCVCHETNLYLELKLISLH